MPKPLLCVTVTAPTMAELRRQRDEVVDADLIELRLDSVSDPDVAGALAGRRCPVIVTCRPEWEGGRFKGAEEDRRRLLADAWALGAEYVDIESRARFDDLLAQSGGRRVVLSYHDFDAVPVDLAGLVQAMRSTGAEVVKVAVKTARLSDCVPLRDVGALAGRQAGLVVIAMGPFGLATRVLAGRFGSMWTYAGSDHEVGQVSAASLLNEYRFRECRTFPAVLASDRKVLLHTRLATFGEHPSGLGKFTRSMFARDLRRTVTTDSEAQLWTHDLQISP